MAGKYGKGVLVQKTLWGNLILGPTARDVHEWADPKIDPDSKESVRLASPEPPSNPHRTRLSPFLIWVVRRQCSTRFSPP